MEKVNAILIALLVVSLSFMPAASAKAETAWCEHILNSEDININDFDVELNEYEKIGDDLYYNGIFKIDIEKKSDGKAKKIKATGTITEIIKADGSINIEYLGDNFNIVMDLSPLEEKESVLYNYELSLNIDGESKTTREIIEVPIKQLDNNNLQEVVSSSEETQFSLVSSTKTKIDIPSAAPLGAVLIHNNLQYADLMATIGIVGAIATVIGCEPALVVTVVLEAVLYAIPEYAEIDPHDIYIDIFVAPLPANALYVEVDYFYI